jgi:hypothetical protein
VRQKILCQLQLPAALQKSQKGDAQLGKAKSKTKHWQALGLAL